jgi:maltooligosyltrehalose trehalohydrolase
VQTVGLETGKPRTLLTDGRGLSDRLTSLVVNILQGRAPDPTGLIRRLADDVEPVGAPPRSAPANLRRAYRATQRSAPVLVGDLTRLPAAARTVPWFDDAGSDASVQIDVDDRAVMLACAILAGTPVVLDTEHAPVGVDGPEARRLVDWASALLTLRPGAIDDASAPVDVTAADGVLAVRRARSVLLIRLDPEPGEIDLARYVGAPLAEWRVIAAWHHDSTVLAEGRMNVPGRTVVVLRAGSDGLLDL